MAFSLTSLDLDAEEAAQSIGVLSGSVDREEEPFCWAHRLATNQASRENQICTGTACAFGYFIIILLTCVWGVRLETLNKYLESLFGLWGANSDGEREQGPPENLYPWGMQGGLASTCIIVYVENLMKWSNIYQQIELILVSVAGYGQELIEDYGCH